MTDEERQQLFDLIKQAKEGKQMCIRDRYFCIYEKDYEQYVKLGTPLEEADIINRFEIRLRNERAYYAVRDLLTYYDAEQTAFSIINQHRPRRKKQRCFPRIWYHSRRVDKTSI